MFSRKLASININAISSIVKKNLLKDFVWNNDIDFLFLQEVAFENFNFIPSHNAFVNISEDNKGTAILVRRNIETSDILLNPNGRISSIRIGGINFINIYAHSGSGYRKERDLLFSQDIIPHLSCDSPNVLLGDFNCILLNKDSNGTVKNISQGLKQLVDSLDLEDIGITINKKPHFTFFRGESMSRLDRVYGPKSFLDKVHSFESVATSFSDHHALIVKYKTQSNDDVTVLGKGYWKINPSLLHDEDIRDEFINIIRETRRRIAYEGNFCSWWDNHLKTKARSFFKSKSFQNNCLINNSKSFLYGCLKELTVKQNEGCNVSQEMCFVKSKLMAIENSRLENLRLKVHTSNIFEDEKIGLFQISKRIANGKSDPLKLSVDGVVTSESKKVKFALENHFKALYDKDNVFYPGATNMLDAIEKHLSLAERECLVAPIQLFELELALQQSSKKKSPGPDGLTYEFYSVFFEELKHDLIKLFNCFLNGTQPEPSFTAGIITLIPKKENSTSIHDKRPISMLNCDYKLYTKILYNRVQPLIESLVGSGQTACLSNQSCTTNLKQIRNIVIKSSSSKSFKGSIVSLDLEKAFDRVDHNFLWLVLEKFGFPPQFIICLQNLYGKATSKILFNGTLTNDIQIKSSVRQGCPLSMALFVLYIEPLIRKMSNCIKGCFIDNNFYKVIVYADDITIFIRDDEEFDSILEIINSFSLFAKIKLNVRKSRFMRLNNCRTGPHLLTEVNSLKILGVEIFQNFNDTVNFNYSKIIQSIKFLIQIHQKRNLNIFQKTWILNHLILSKLWYLSQVFPPNNSHLAEIKTVSRNFIFKGIGIFRVCLNQLYLDVERGGLNVIDIDSKTKSMFIKNILKGNQNGGKDNFMLRQEYNQSISRNARDLIRTAHDTEQCIDVTTCKTIYNFFISQQNIIPRITLKFPNKPWEILWQNLNQKFLSSDVKHFIFLVINDIIPSKEKLCDKRIQGNSDKTCNSCGRIDTIEHRFKTCGSSETIWKWITRNIKEKLKISINDPTDMLGRVIGNNQYQSKVALWLATLGIAYNLKNSKSSLEKFIDTVREKRWENRKLYENSFKRWINVL